MWIDCRPASGAAPWARGAGLEIKGRGGRADVVRARVVLQALASGMCWLAREMLSNGPRWAVFESAGAGARLLQQVPESLARALTSGQLVEPLEDGDVARWRISAAGRRWLARHVPELMANPPAGHTEDSSADNSPPAGKKYKGKATRHGRLAGQGGSRQPAQRGAQREVQRLLVRDAETGALREVAVNLKENPLMWLARRKDANGQPFLQAHHVAAGERLRQDYEIACMQPQITASWNPALVAADRGRLKSGPRDPFPFAERVILARERVHKALENIGAELADIAVAVCCLGNGIEAAERALNWPRRSARLVLRIALERLADHYGLKPARQQGAPGWRKVLDWHAEDGRPSELVPAEKVEDNDTATTDDKG